MRFVNRKNELEHLEKEYRKKGSSFAVIYGRRRVGKTALIEEFIKDKEGVYYLAAQEEDKLQIKEFKEAISKFIDDDFLSKNEFGDWKQIFSYLSRIWPKDKKIVLAIDETTFIIKENSSFPSYLQKFWDQFLSRTNTFLILSGSLVGLMLKSVLSYDSPLYGRRTSQIYLEEFSFKDSIEFMRGKSVEDQIRFYSITGGVAKYLLFVEEEESFEDFILNNLFSKEGFFYREGVFLLSQEFKDPSTYVNILKAISYGNTKLNDISNFVGIESKKISSYIEILIRLNILRKEIPFNANEKRFRGAIYLFNDNFLTFWHRFIHPNRSMIEMRRGEELMENNMDMVNAFIGLQFEKVCREMMSYFYPNVGRWWGKGRGGKEIEIDVVGKSEKEVAFGECKWKLEVDAKKVLEYLKERSNEVQVKGQRKYFIFAKSFKEKLDENGVFLYDLEDIKNFIEGR